MNIFVSSPSPMASAIALDDKRVNKMILESAQMLSTAMIFNGSHGPYRQTHVNHPCSIWTRTNRANYNWLIEHMVELSKEFEYRRYKIHASSLLIPQLIRGAASIPDGNMTPFVNASRFKDREVHEAYRLTLIDKWSNDKLTPKWTNRDRPQWLTVSYGD